MVSITKNDNQFTINILGFHKFWALLNKIKVNQDQIVNVYQDLDEMKRWKGWRVGTYIPFVITAGTYYSKNKSNFWDVTNNQNTIIIELKNHRFNKLFIDVKNPDEMIALLKP